MTSLGQTKLLLLIITVFSAMFLLALPWSGAMAQGIPATPTNIGDGGGGSGGGSGTGNDRTTAVPLKAGVSGYVYNYSTGGYEGGVQVVIEGGGWQIETESDSNGFYHVRDLGTGMAVVNLRLPPGTQPVVIDAPVTLGNGITAEVDLGFYWGDEPPMPVVVTSQLEGNLLTIQIKNRTSETATGGIIEIDTPAGIRVLPTVNSSQGQVINYDSHQLQVDTGDIAPGATIIIEVQLNEVPSLVAANQPMPAGMVSFNYDQQHTPQMMPVDSNQFIETILPASSEDATEIEAQAGQSEDAAAEMSLQSEPSAETTQPTPEEQLPVTGSSPTNPFGGQWVLGAILLLCLSGAGWWATQHR